MLPYKDSTGAERAKGFIRARNGEHLPAHLWEKLSFENVKQTSLINITSKRDFIVIPSLWSCCLVLMSQGGANFSFLEKVYSLP